MKSIDELASKWVEETINNHTIEQHLGGKLFASYLAENYELIERRASLSPSTSRLSPGSIKHVEQECEHYNDTIFCKCMDENCKNAHYDQSTRSEKECNHDFRYGEWEGCISRLCVQCGEVQGAGKDGFIATPPERVELPRELGYADYWKSEYQQRTIDEITRTINHIIRYLRANKK